MSDIWQLVGLLLSFLGVLFALGKLLLSQIDRRLESRFKAVEDQVEAWRALEREFLRFQATLPVEYVRREDYVRGQSVIEAKLDAIAGELKLVQIKGSRDAA